ncbi:MAG: T9SS type A sorting domain-containing protein [Bacteroidetes bacterium]|nr:T9SS type A sorting domain-containing protein [Bacteroidota bacterium]
MRKPAFLFLLIFTLVKLQAQDYLINFEGTGAAAAVDSVKVENLSQGTSLYVYSGNQLHLLGTVSAVGPGSNNNVTSLMVSPNPSDGEVMVIFEATVAARATIILCDLTGREVASAESFFSIGPQSFSISGLETGTYLVLVKSEHYRYNGKIFSRSTSAISTRIRMHGQVTRQDSPENLKQASSMVVMQYNTGDLLKFTGRSGIHGTVYMDVPTATKTITFNFILCTDYDNNSYTIVQIDDQWWMAENLKATKYNTGDDIPEVTGQSNWMGQSSGAYCYFDNDPNNALVYGCLYNWYAATDYRNPCPANWHVPSDDEWILLTSFLGGEAIAGGKMKETGIVHWFSPNTGATNESGFTVIAGGNRSYGNFDAMGYGGSFWSTTPFDDVFAWNRDIFYYTTAANRHGTDKKSGLSLRCVKN